ncbi:MAG TPA: Imm10 family immunity protein, partial [Pseudonocardiaceae bacterium]|nr:Imm10 family immunity protein [Pseudonocardiaceae bacterium]
AGEHAGDGVYLIAASENPDGSGRAITIQIDLNQPAGQRTEPAEAYCITLEPGHATHYGGIISYNIVGRRLHLQFTPAAASDLQVDPSLTFDLHLDDQHLTTLEAGLQRTLSTPR